MRHLDFKKSKTPLIPSNISSIYQVPSSYNESGYILFTITVLAFESVTFFMIFKNLDYISYIRYSAVCIIVGDFMTYFALFIPRLYIILFKPDRNTLQLQCSTTGQQLRARTVDRACNTSLEQQGCKEPMIDENGDTDLGKIIVLTDCDNIVLTDCDKQQSVL